jgi:glycosyltransferase involved in cell wall biosynthesis
MLTNSDAYPDVKAEIKIFDKQIGFPRETQAVFATGWETAYPSFLAQTYAKRFYFVQDYEPYFYPVGSDSLLAENTYKFGFHGITAGGWLAQSLNKKFGMKTDYFDFAVDKSLYYVTNFAPRNEVFFYARPVTPRRAFEFGLLALSEFAKMRPDVKINLAGWDIATWNIPFKHTNLSSLPLRELNDVYNRCGVGLVLSLTNMSLLPLELISSGVTPVVNEGENNFFVTDNPFIEYVPASPKAIARKMVEILERSDAIKRSQLMSDSVTNVDWEDSAQQFLHAFEGAMRG